MAAKDNALGESALGERMYFQDCSYLKRNVGMSFIIEHNSKQLILFCKC